MGENKKNSFFIYSHGIGSECKFDLIILTVIFFSILFVPYIPLSSSFYLSIEELLLSVVGLRLLWKRIIWIDYFVLVLLFFSFYIFFTICINRHFYQWNEYFEIFKVLKLLLIYVYTIHCFYKSDYSAVFHKIINISFILLFLINIVHYFDFFDFTRKILIYYDSDRRDISSFGLNSLGEASARRIVGTFGNPNDNAILFLLYFAYYASKISELNKKRINSSRLFFYASTFLVFLTQSRTALIALAVLIILHLISNRHALKQGIYDLLFIVVSLLLFTALDNLSINYLTNTHIVLSENTSVTGRFEIWHKLIDLWKEKPLFGYGPNKEYIYSRDIYPENEYIFFLWRYGSIGLIIYMFILFFPFLFFRNRVLKNKFLFYTILIVAITALTNNPLSNMKFMFLIGIIYGYSIIEIYGLQKLKPEMNVAK